MAAIESSKSPFVDRIDCRGRGVGSGVAIGSQPVRSGILVRISRGVNLLQSNNEWCSTIGCCICPWCRLNSHSRLDDRGRRARCVGCTTSTDMSCESDSLSVTCLGEQGERGSDWKEFTRYHLVSASQGWTARWIGVSAKEQMWHHDRLRVERKD